jgi:type II secretory pathway component PulF
MENTISYSSETFDSGDVCPEGKDRVGISGIPGYESPVENLGEMTYHDDMTQRPGDELVLFCRLLQMAVESGLSLPRSLREFAAHLDEGAARRWAETLSGRLNSGHSLAEAVAGLDGMDPFLGILVSVPDGRGLGAVLAAYARFLMMARVVKEKLQTALFYPLLVLGMAGLNLLFCNLHLFPAMREAFTMKHMEMPLVMKGLYVFDPSTWPLSPLVVFLIFALPVWFGWLAMSGSLPRSGWNPLSRVLFLYAFHLAEKRSRMFETIALALDSGRTLPESLRLAKIHESDSSGREALESCAAAIEQGSDAAGVFAQSPVFGPMGRLIQAEGGAKQWVAAFRNVSRSELDRAQQIPQTIELVCGTVALLLAGLLVGLCGYAFFSPYYEFASAAWK